MTRRPVRAALRQCSCALLSMLALAGPASAGGALLDDVSRAVLGGRYLSPSGGCTPGDRSLLGWSADRLVRCRYEVTDVLRDGSRRSKAGIVYLANPSPERVLAWLESACRRAGPTNVEGCVREEALAIRLASGAQFPVAGLVWEDQACGSPLGRCHGGSDGLNEGYVFRNGVTVRVAGFANGSTDPVDDALLERLTTAQEVTGIRRGGGYARILSTSREQYVAFDRRPGIPVGEGSAGAAIAWSDLVGELYRQALSDNENPLITASVCSHKKMPLGCNATH